MNAGKPPSRDWRAQPPVQSAYAREWRGSDRRGPERFSRKIKLRVVSVGLVVLVAAILVLIAPAANRVPPIQIVTFGIGLYGGQGNPQGTMPINPFGEQDARAFQVLNDLYPAQFLPVRQENNVLNSAQFLNFLQSESSNSTLAGQHLIVFCTLHGLVEPAGDVDLYAIDATPDSPSNAPATMIPFKELVTRLQSSPARRVLLLLDASRLDSDWRMGILNNDVSAQLSGDWPASKAGVTGSSEQKVTILTAAGPGQRSWPGESGSAFVRAVIDGLAGAADGWSDNPSSSSGGAKDRRVSLNEFVAFARHRVDDWTRRKFGVRQTVKLFGNTADFDLAIASSSSGAITLSGAKLSSKPPAVNAAGLKAAATKAAKDDGASKEATKADATEQTDDVAASAKENSTERKTPEPKASKGVDENWKPRLTELLKARDEWSDAGRRGRHPVCRQNPLTWRTFQAKLGLAAALSHGGMDELFPQAVEQADSAYKKLQSQSQPDGLGFSLNDVQRKFLVELGFESNASPSTETLNQVGKSLLTLLKEAAAAPATNAAQPAATQSASPALDRAAVTIWLLQEVRRDPTPENWERCRQIISQLDRTGQMPVTADTQFLRDVLAVADGPAKIGRGDSLTKVFDLRGRIRRLATLSPESLPLIGDSLQAAMRSLIAAERWLLATDSSRPEVREWLEKSDEALSAAELTTRRYSETLGIWSDLLDELPHIASWVAARASDDDQRKVEWDRLKHISRRWAESERDHKWDHDFFRNNWPDKPARLTDLERSLLAQLVNAQALKAVLLADTAATSNSSVDEIAKLTNRAIADRSDFWELFRRSIPRLGTADHPSPTVWRDADRLLELPWVSSNDRRSLAPLRQLEPRGDALPDRSPEANSLWQGFWAIASISLLSNDKDETGDLWNDWERLVDLSTGRITSRAVENSADDALLRKRRAELGRGLRQQRIKLQGRASNLTSFQTQPLCQLMAATLDPEILPEIDPDVQIRTARQRQFFTWLTVLANDWRKRGGASANRDSGYLSLAARADALSVELGNSNAPLVDAGSSKFQEEKRPAFDADRRARLDLAIESKSTVPGAPLKISLLGSRVRLLENGKSVDLRQPSIRNISSEGRFSAELKLDDDVDVAQPLLVALIESDGYPVDFRQILLYPPFDPSRWRIEFSEASTNTPLEHVPLANVTGVKTFVPPSGAITLRASLLRPAKDVTPSARVSMFAITESGRVPLIEDLDLKLESGKERTVISFDVPAIPKDKDPAPKEKIPPGPLADLARGILFVITPEGQSPLEYHIRPTFWSASKFIAEPQPVVRDDRMLLEIERRQLNADDVLQPKKIPVELTLPDSLRNAVSDYTLGGPMTAGQKLTLSFAMPKNWIDQARDRHWNFGLDVAGLPHAYRWRIEPTGTISPIGGLPPQLSIGLILAPSDPKSPARLEPVIRKGQEPLHLQFQVDATELDRTEETGDWILNSTIVRETDSGSEPTPLQRSWRLFSSIQRHVLLDAVQGGVWKIRTSAENYDLEEAAADIRGLSGRFVVQSTLSRSAAPTQALATANFKFAIDDEAPPSIDVKGVSVDARPIDKDFAFRIEAIDPESGIQRLAYGFDKNSDKQLQEDEELLEERNFIGIDNPKVTWSAIIGRLKLPPLQKDEETRQLIVEARNGLGTKATRVYPVTFRKAPTPKKLTTGTLVVSMSVSRGAKTTVQISGPEARLEETKADSITFTELPPGQYQIKVNVNYAVIGRKDEGEAKVDVKVGETKTAKVPLSAAK